MSSPSVQCDFIGTVHSGETLCFRNFGDLDFQGAAKDLKKIEGKEANTFSVVLDPCKVRRSQGSDREWKKIGQQSIQFIVTAVEAPRRGGTLKFCLQNGGYITVMKELATSA